MWETPQECLLSTAPLSNRFAGKVRVNKREKHAPRHCCMNQLLPSLHLSRTPQFPAQTFSLIYPLGSNYLSRGALGPNRAPCPFSTIGPPDCPHTSACVSGPGLSLSLLLSLSVCLRRMRAAIKLVQLSRSHPDNVHLLETHPVLVYVDPRLRLARDCKSCWPSCQLAKQLDLCLEPGWKASCHSTSSWRRGATSALKAWVPCAPLAADAETSEG